MCCVLKRKTTTLMYNNITCFFSCFSYPMGGIRESRRWLKCTYTRATVRFFCETSLPFCFVLPGSKSSLAYIIYQRPTQSSWSHLQPTCYTWTRLLYSMPPTQLTWYFRWENTCVVFPFGNRWLPVFFLLPVSDSSCMPPTQFTQQFRWGICVMFTLGNRSVSCYATHAIYAVCQKRSSSQYSRCGNYRVTIHQASKLDYYPIPN